MVQDLAVVWGYTTGGLFFFHILCCNDANTPPGLDSIRATVYERHDLFEKCFKQTINLCQV